MGGHLKSLRLISVEPGDEGENSTVRILDVEELFSAKSAADIELRGKILVSREKDVPWDAGQILGEVYCNPEKPVRFHVENGQVRAQAND
jgi:hypothetical protein